MTSEHRCGGRTDGYGGFTCVGCGKYHPMERAMTSEQKEDVVTGYCRVCGDQVCTCHIEDMAWAKMKKPTDAEIVEVIKLAFCQTEIPHLKGYSMADYYRTYPELASRSDEHAKAAFQKLREKGMI